MEIQSHRRTYSEAILRRIALDAVYQPLPRGRTVWDEVAIILDVQEIMPGSAAQAREVIEDELRRVGRL